MGFANPNVEKSVGNKFAQTGEVYVCLACGKRSQDKYGTKPISHGWDASCMLNCDVFNEEDLVIENGRVIKINKTG
jgi:hypothetical protein